MARLKLKPLVIGLAAAGMAATAQAEPVTAAVAAIGAAMGGTAGAYMIMNAAAVAAGVLKVGALAAMTLYSRNKAKREARRARDAYNASLRDRTMTMAGTNLPLQHIYGRATVASSPVAMFTRGSKDEIKDVVVVWAGHECDAIEDVLIAGESLELDGAGNATAQKWSSVTSDVARIERDFSGSGAFSLPADANNEVISITRGAGDESVQLPVGYYTISAGVVQLVPAAMEEWAGQHVYVQYQREIRNSQVRVRHHLGAADQVADVQLIADTAGLTGAWTASDRLQGLCYSIFTLDLNNAELQSGFPQVTAKIRGRRVLDPRTALVAWSQNSALCVYDFLRAQEYGKGVLPEQIEGVVAAANACDELITVTDGGQTVTAPRYTANGAWLSDEDPDSVLEDLCRSMAGFAVPGGAWRIQAGVYAPPVMVLDDALAAGALGLLPAPGRADAHNGVRGQYIDPGQYNQAIDYEPLQVPQYVEDDGGEVWGPLNFPFADSGWRARTLAAISLEQSRAKELQWTGKPACLRAQVGDRVLVHNALLGLAGESFRVTKRSYEPEKQTVTLSLKADKPGDYASVSNAAQPSPGVQPDDTYRVSSPTGLVLTNPAPGQIRIYVDSSPDLRVQQGGSLLIQVRAADSNSWVSMPSASGNATEQTITVLQRGVYIVQVDWRASTGQQSGKWLSGAVTVEETAYATPDDVSNAVAGSATKTNPVFTGVVGLPEYLKAALPPVGGDNVRKTILVSDATAGPSICVSDGTDWISQITGDPVT